MSLSNEDKVWLLEQIENSNLKTRSEIKDIKDILEEHDRRIRAKESFPTPPYNNLPQQPNVITQGSVSNPKWGKRSIFG